MYRVENGIVKILLTDLLIGTMPKTQDDFETVMKTGVKRIAPIYIASTEPPPKLTRQGKTILRRAGAELVPIKVKPPRLSAEADFEWLHERVLSLVSSQPTLLCASEIEVAALLAVGFIISHDHIDLPSAVKEVRRSIGCHLGVGLDEVDFSPNGLGFCDFGLPALSQKLAKPSEPVKRRHDLVLQGA